MNMCSPGTAVSGLRRVMRIRSLANRYIPEDESARFSSGAGLTTGGRVEDVPVDYGETVSLRRGARVGLCPVIGTRPGWQRRQAVYPASSASRAVGKSTWFAGAMRIAAAQVAVW
jgi:hypothetical protein